MEPKKEIMLIGRAGGPMPEELLFLYLK